MDEANGAGAATIEFEHVSKHYDAATLKSGAAGAVDDLSLTVPAGRICVLVGPSGCGKTTTLKMVNRLIEPTDGRILIDGVDISGAGRDRAASRHRLRHPAGRVSSRTRRIAENVATVPRLLGWDKRRQRERADELLSIVGLEPGKYRERYPSQLSGGERQRVGVARALAADPPVMLMDEPFGAVDPIVRERLQNEFLRLQEDLAKTILFVTHDIDEAIKMGDLVVVMQLGGKIAQAGAPAELLAEPASDYVARFVGADRGLKRLSLYRVGDVDLAPAPLARVGRDRRPRYASGPRPWTSTSCCSSTTMTGPSAGSSWPTCAAMASCEAADADPMSPLLDRRTTLKDATSRLLDEEVRNGVVVDRDGRVRGLLTLRAIMDWMQDDRSRDVPEDIAEAVADAVVIEAEPAPPA